MISRLPASSIDSALCANKNVLREQCDHVHKAVHHQTLHNFHAMLCHSVQIDIDVICSGTSTFSSVLTGDLVRPIDSPYKRLPEITRWLISLIRSCHAPSRDCEPWRSVVTGFPVRTSVL